MKWPTSATMNLLSWLLMAIGGVFIAHVAYLLVVYGSYHFGVVVIALLGLGALALGFSLNRFGWVTVRRWLHAHPWRRRAWKWGGWALVVWFCTLMVFFALIRSGRDGDSISMPTIQTIMVLGGGAPHCHAPPTVQRRLDEGLKQALRWPMAKVVVTGGPVAGYPCSEASVMAKYLIDNGLPASRIIVEDQSTSTHLNMVLSQRLMQQQGISPSDGLVVVTSDFHTLRSRLIAQHAGFKNVVSVSAVTPLYARYSANVREYFAYISGKLLNEF